MTFQITSNKMVMTESLIISTGLRKLISLEIYQFQPTAVQFDLSMNAKKKRLILPFLDSNRCLILIT